MIKILRGFWELLVEAGEEFVDDHASKLSASLAYYALFSIGPLLLVIITLLGFFYRKMDVSAEIFDEVRALIGANATGQLQTILTNMSQQTNKTLIGIIGILVFVFGATGIFSEIQSSMNFLWSVKAKPKRSWLKYITDRLLSLVLVIGLGALMMVTILLNFLVDLAANRLKQLPVDVNIVLLKAVNLGLLFVIVTLVFFVIFKVLPDAWVHWKDALVGAIFTTVLFVIGKFLLSYYFGISKSLNLYGAATSIILVLSWVYYCAMILYYGGEFTEAYAHRFGKGIKVNHKAVHIHKHEKEVAAPRKKTDGEA